MFEQSNRTEEEWNLQITELMLEPRVFAKVS